MTNANTTAGVSTDTQKWLAEHYFRFVSAEIQGAIQYLNQSITWAVGIVTANLAFVASQSVKPQNSFNVYFLASLVAMALLTHFFARGVRAYVNVMRYTTLTKKLTDARLSSDHDWGWDPNKLLTLVNDIKKFHVNWVSPVKKSTVLRKFFLEFGFGLFYLVVCGSALYSAFFYGFSCIELIALLVAIFFVFIEIWTGLLSSSYFEQIEDYAVHP